MRTQTSGETSAWTQKMRALVAGLMLAAVLLASMTAAAPAHAETTLIVNDTGDFHDFISGNGDIGISLGDGSAANLIKGNYVGTDKSGTKDLGNDGKGIQVATGVDIIGASPGKLNSIANENYTIEFYANPKDTNDGKKFIGQKSVTTTVDGIRSFTFTPATAVSAGQGITATATRETTRDTSESSAPTQVASS